MKCKICKSKTKTWYEKLYDDRHGYPGYFDVVRCTKCGFAQTKPQIGKKEIGKLYEKYYPRQNLNLENIKRESYSSINRTKLWRKGLLNACHFLVDKGSSVLDVGAGLGYSLLWLEEAMNCKAYGIDPDENAKKVADKFNLNFHIGFIEDRPFGNKKFDFVIANQTIEHTNEPVRFLRECNERVKKDGQIILSFPSIDSLTRKLLGKNWLHWHIPYHLNHFNHEGFSRAADKAGLKVDTIKTITPNQWTNIQLRCLIQKSEMGQRDSFWDPGKSAGGKPSLATSLLHSTMLFLEEYNLFNRFIDFLGLGESYVVFLSAKNGK